MRKVIFVCILFSGLFHSCIKAPSYSIIPHIEFVSVSSQNVVIPPNPPNGIFTAIDTITFSFTDGDGDIGILSMDTDTSQLCSLQEGDSTILHSKRFNIFLIDNRGNECVTPFASGNVPTNGKYKAASGNIQVIPSLSSDKCVRPNPTCLEDTVIYSIILTDEAGHRSNTIQTVPIYIIAND